MAIKNIFVCGDSFCSADTNHPYSHFSELLQKMGYSVRNLARGGITNTAICFQIKEAIEHNADLVIFTSTSVDRLDIPLKTISQKLQLKNFIYPYTSDLSSRDSLVGGLDAEIYSDVIPALVNPRPDLSKSFINAELKQAIEYYIAYLHDNKLKAEIDNWIIDYWKSKITSLHLNSIPQGQILFEYVKQNPDKINQAVYHTDKATQELCAENLKILIDKL